MAPLKQAATLWGATPDGYGGYTFGAPTAVLCRWEERSELLPNSTEMAKAVVYVDQDISVEDYLVLGTTTEVSPLVAGASRVREFKKVPDLRNLQALRKVWL